MKFHTFERRNVMRGACILGIFALVTVGLAGFRSEIEPEEMRNKSDLELEAILDPLAEELAADHSRRMLSEYRASKGLFTCEGVCPDKRERWLQSEAELAFIQAQKLKARRASRVRQRIAKRVRVRTMTPKEIRERMKASEERVKERRKAVARLQAQRVRLRQRAREREKAAAAAADSVETP